LARSFGTRPPSRFRFEGESSTGSGQLARSLDQAANLPSRNPSTRTRVLRKWPRIGNLEVVHLPQGLTVKQAIAAFQASGQVEYAEPDYLRWEAATYPNDPFFTDQTLWSLHNTGQHGGTPDADVDAPEGWDYRYDASPVIVAVIDSGIRYDHQDLHDNMWRNVAELNGTPGQDDDDNGYVDDVYGINAITGSGDPMALLGAAVGLVTPTGPSQPRAQEPSQPVYFLLVPLTHKYHPDADRNQSCVVPLSQPEHIEHARQLIALDTVNRTGTMYDPLPRGYLLAGRVARGSDGINRNYSVPGFPAWSWHLTGRLGFGDSIIWEIAAAPSRIEAFIDYHVEEGAGFLSFTVGQELGNVPLYLAVERQGGQLWFYWSGVGTNAFYTLETAESPTSKQWTLVVGGLAESKTNQWSMPLPEGPARFYRVRAETPP